MAIRCRKPTIADEATNQNGVVRSRVTLSVIAAPARPTFDEMAESFLGRYQSKIIDWEIQTPAYIAGRILEIDF